MEQEGGAGKDRRQGGESGSPAVPPSPVKIPLHRQDLKMVLRESPPKSISGFGTASKERRWVALW